MTAQEIINELEEMIQKKIPLSAEYWLEKYSQLAILIGNETDELFNLKKKVAQEKVQWLEKGKSSAEAKTRVEATDLYEQMLKQGAKVERIEEIMRSAKLQAKYREFEFRNS